MFFWSCAIEVNRHGAKGEKWLNRWFRGRRVFLGLERPRSGARKGAKILATRPVARGARTPEDPLTGIGPALGDPNEEDLALALAAPDDARGRRPDTECASPR